MNTIVIQMLANSTSVLHIIHVFFFPQTFIHLCVHAHAWVKFIYQHVNN